MSLASSQEAGVSPALTSARHWTACAVSLPGCKVPGPAAPSLGLQQGRTGAAEGRQTGSEPGRKGCLPQASQCRSGANQGQKCRHRLTPGNPGTQTAPRLARSSPGSSLPPDPGATAGCLIQSCPLHQTSQRLTAPVTLLPTRSGNQLLQDEPARGSNDDTRGPVPTRLTRTHPNHHNTRGPLPDPVPNANNPKGVHTQAA